MLFVGDDWAEDHHDVEIIDEAGRRLARRRLNRLIGILHGCLKTGTLYDETTAWAHHHIAAA